MSFEFPNPDENLNEGGDNPEILEMLPVVDDAVPVIGDYDRDALRNAIREARE